MAPPSDKRTRLIIAANRLFHRNGYEDSSIAEIAEAAGVPPGNVYYYFKTKEELAVAVIERRLAYISAWLGELDASSNDPSIRLIKFVEEFEGSAKLRAAYGCPVGGFAQEANRQGGEIAALGRRPLEALLGWLQQQLTETDTSAGAARSDAVHILTSLEGASLMAHTFGEPGLLLGEAERLKIWLRQRFLPSAVEA